jgi:hypothetical protein
MTKEKSNKTEGEKSPLSDFRSPIIFLGVLIAALAGIYRLFPQFWDTYWLTLLLIAAGLAIPFLFSPRKFWAGYGWQVGIAPGLAFVLIGIFVWFFGYRENALWEDAVRNLILTNSIILVVWLVLVFAAFRSRPGKDTTQQQKKQDSERDQKSAQLNYRKGEIWRDYRWIIAPAVIILLFLFDTSWAQSTLSTISLKKSVFPPPTEDTPQFHAEYPSQILFDDIEPSEIRIWADSLGNCGEEVEISAAGLLFAVKPSSDSSIIWREKLTFNFNKTTNAVTLLAQPSKPPDSDSLSAQIHLMSNGRLFDTSTWVVRFESKRDAQIRAWKNNFLDTGGTIVSLITAVFVGVKQLEEEKKRQKTKQVEQALSKLETNANEDLSKTLQELWNLTANWNEWDKALQNQFRRAYSTFIEQKLWDALAAKTLAEITSDVDLCLQICERIFDDKEEKPISTLKQLQSALRQDEEAPLALLSLLKEYPSSINIAKIIASAFPLALKAKTIADYKNEFPNQIQALRVELGFIDTESFPLQAQFTFYTKPHISEDRLTAWLKAHELDCSPFADADSPFYSVPDKQLLITHATPGFALSTSDFQNITFEFANAWDAGTALFEFCITLRSNLRLKNDIFFLVVTPGMVDDYGADHPRKLLLHALAEQWIWLLAEEPTLFYSLESGQRELRGRLLRWHDLSPSITVNKIAKFARHLDGMKKERENEEKENQTVFFSKITEWLGGMSANELQTEEINALIGLRPAPTQRTLFLISTIDLNPHVKRQISPSLHEQLGAQSDWLSVHDCGLAHFLVDNKNPKTVSVPALVRQCNIRVQKCSRNKIEFNQLFDAPGEEPDAILAQKADGSPGRMVRLGQKLLMQHVEKYPLDELLHIEDLIALEL